MTLGELKIAIADLPDDMPVANYSDYDLAWIDTRFAEVRPIPSLQYPHSPESATRDCFCID